MADHTGDQGGPELRLWLCCLVPAVVALALLWPVVESPSAWLWPPGADYSDLAVSHWPGALFTRRMLWEERQLPVWRPTIMSGAPFAANPLSGVCYAPNWLLLFLPWLPLGIGFNVSAMVHLWLAGVAMCAFMRVAFRCGTWGALAAAVAYEASPKLVAHLAAGHVGWTQAMAWLPLVLLCWLQALRMAAEGGRLARSCRWAVAGGAAAACQFCADTRAAAYSLAAGAALTVAWLLARWRANRQRSVGPARVVGNARSAWCWLAAVSCGLASLAGLAACQWVPLLALLPELTRSSMELQDAAVWSLPWRYLAGLLVADHSGFHEWMTYVGVSTLVLAALGAWGLLRRREERWLVCWLGIMLGGAVWFSLGENGGLFNLLGRAVPGLVLLRVPPRAWALVTFSSAVLAGVGVDKVIGPARYAIRVRRTGRLALTALAAFAVLLVLGYWVAVGRPQPALLAFSVVTPLTAWVCLLARRAGDSGRAAVAAVCLMALDLGIVDSTLVIARPEEDVFAQGRSAAEWLAAQQGEFLAYSPSYSIPQHLAELHHLRLADGVDPLQLEVYADYLTRAAGLERGAYGVTLPPFPDGADVSTALQDVVPDAQMLGLLGVRYAAAAFPISDADWEAAGEFDGVFVYENRQYQAAGGPDQPGTIALADGTILFRYDPNPVSIGWAVSAVTVAAVLTGLAASRHARGGSNE